MSLYVPKKIHPLRLVAMALRGLVKLLKLWPLLVIAAIVLSPVGPYLRWEYRYQQRGPLQYFTDCTYLSIRGFVRMAPNPGHCPFFLILDHRQVND